MEIIMNRAVFDSLADHELIWACIEPAIGQSRGKQFNNNAELHTSIDRMNAKLREVIPETLQRIGAYVRNNPKEFLQIEG